MQVDGAIAMVAHTPANQKNQNHIPMAKRNKNKFASKGRKSALRVEALEQRQLLAAVSGAGTELTPGGAGADHYIEAPNHNHYDQVLMTGSTVTISNDVDANGHPANITRVSFLDLNGDIVQAEFAGKGSLTISLDDATTGVSPTHYNQDVQYVQGLASFTISGADDTTSINIFTVGTATAVNQALFDDTHTGGDHWADVQRLTIVADPDQPNGSTFGSIFAGDVHFSGTSGVVGIAAANVHVEGLVRIGNIDAEDTASPTLVFGAASQFGAVYVQGGDLLSGNGNAINNVGGSGFQNPYVYDIEFVAGAGSDGTIVAASHLMPGVQFQGAIGFVSTLDATESLDITGHDQAWLDDHFAGRTFTHDITITGDLASGLSINAAAFRGNVEFTGDIAGDVVLQDINNSDLPVAAFGGTLTFDGNVSGHVGAEAFAGAVTIGGDLSGVLYAHISSDSGNPVLGTLHDVTIAGNDSGGIWSDWSIGNILIDGDLTNTGGTSFETFGGGGKYAGDIGTITVMGDVNQGGSFLYIAGGGTFGAVTVLGGGTLVNNNVGEFYVNQLTGGETSTGTITVTDDTNLSFEGVVLDSGSGKVGAVTITGTDNNWFALDGQIYGGDVGEVTVSGFHAITINDDIHANGAFDGLSLTASASTDTVHSSVTLYGDISAKTVGAIAIDSNGDNSHVLIDGVSISASASIATLDVTGGSVTVENTEIVAENGGNHATSVGAVTITATDGDVNITHVTDLAYYYNGGNWTGGDVGAVAVTASHDISFSSNSYIEGGTVGNVSFDAGHNIDLRGNIFASVSIGDVSGTAGNTAYIGDQFDVASEDGSISSVTFTSVGHMGFYGNLDADTIGDVTVTSTAGAIYADNFDINATTHLGNVAFTAYSDVDLEGHINGGAIDSISATSTGYYDGGYYGDVNFNVSVNAASIGAVTLSAYHSVEISANIYASDTIGSVTATATYGSVTLNAEIYAYTSIGSVAFTAYDNVTFSGEYGWIGSNGSIGLDGGVTLTAGNDISFNTYDGSGSGIYADTLGTVTLDAGNDIDFHYYSGIWANTAGDISLTGDTTFHSDGSAYSGIYIGDAQNITFTGDTTFEENGHLVVGTAKAITFDGALYAYSYHHGSNIQVDTADSITVTGNTDLEGWTAANITINDSIGSIAFGNDSGDTTYLEGHVLDAKTATIGNLTFTNLSANADNYTDGVLQTHIVSGETVFNGNTDLDADSSGGTFWVADDHTSAHDTIGNITFNGTVTGVYDTMDIVASKIGNITIQAPLDLTDNVLVTNLNVFAGNHTAYDYYADDDHAAYRTGETLARDGSNLSDFSIGNITVIDTHPNGTDSFSGTALFAGDGNWSSFDAVGKIGDVTLKGGPNTTVQQSLLFADNSGGLYITAGVFGSADNALNGVYNGGFDFDGIGGIGTVVDTTDYNDNSNFTELVGGGLTLASTRELNSDFLTGSHSVVSVGNVTIWAAAVDPVGSANIDAIANATGFHMYAGVAGTGHNAPDETTAVALDADLTGKIGDIYIKTDYGHVLNMFDGDSQVTNSGSLNADPTAFNGPAYFIATEFGKTQSINLGLTSGDQLIIGNDINETDTDADANEFVVIVV